MKQNLEDLLGIVNTICKDENIDFLLLAGSQESGELAVDSNTDQGTTTKLLYALLRESEFFYSCIQAALLQLQKDAKRAHDMKHHKKNTNLPS